MTTITGNAVEIVDGLPAVCGITVTPLSKNVIANGHVVRFSERKFRTSPNGAFELKLEGGDYRVSFGSGTVFDIRVPADDGTYDFEDRVTSEYIEPTQGVPDNSPLATTATAGRVKLDAAMNPPVVVSQTTFAVTQTKAQASLRRVGDLQGLAMSDPADVTLALVTNTIGGVRVLQIWEWAANSVAADDGVSAIAPINYQASPTGRYILVGTFVLTDAFGSNFRPIGSQLQLLSQSGTWFIPAGSLDPLGLTLALANPDTASANVRRRGGMLELFFDDGQWRAPFLTGDADSPALAFAEVGTAPFQNDQFDGQLWQLRNPATNTFHAWFVTGPDDAPAIAFAAAA